MGTSATTAGPPRGPRWWANAALWVGPPLTFAGAISYFLRPIVLIPALRDFPWVNLPLVLAGAALSVLGFLRTRRRTGAWAPRILAGGALGFSVLLAGLFAAYVFAISSTLPDETATARRLGRLPDLTLPDSVGRPVSLGDLRGQKVVVVFYRGHW